MGQRALDTPNPKSSTHLTITPRPPPPSPLPPLLSPPLPSPTNLVSNHEQGGPAHQMGFVTGLTGNAAPPTSTSGRTRGGSSTSTSTSARSSTKSGGAAAKKRQRPQERKMSEQQKVERRERNREHAKRSRIRKKVRGASGVVSGVREGGGAHEGLGRGRVYVSTIPFRLASPVLLLTFVVPRRNSCHTHTVPA